MRLLLSLLATATIGFFAEFRNEGKFYFKNLHHFFGRGTWIHGGLNQVVPSLGDFLYRIEYSHWNDFLLGPAILSVLFPLAIVRIHKALSDQGPINLSAAFGCVDGSRPGPAVCANSHECRALLVFLAVMGRKSRLFEQSSFKRRSRPAV
jgi:hypothetical protein